MNPQTIQELRDTVSTLRERINESTFDFYRRTGQSSRLQSAISLKPYTVATLPGVFLAGPFSPGTVVNSTGTPHGSVNWTNPNNAKTSDNSYATAVLSSPSTWSQYLKATNFGFSIPTGSTILGIKVEIEGNDGGGTLIYADDTYIFGGTIPLIKGGSLVRPSYPDNGNYIDNVPNADAYLTLGGLSFLWNTTWTPADINDSSFGVAIACITNGAGTFTASIDHIRISVYHTNGQPPLPKGLVAYVSDGLTGTQLTGTGTGSVVFWDGRAWIEVTNGGIARF